MIVESLRNALFNLYNHYLPALLLLLPLIVYYLFIIINRCSTQHILITQKLLVLCLCAMPIVLAGVTTIEQSVSVQDNVFSSSSDKILRQDMIPTVDNLNSVSIVANFTELSNFVSGFYAVILTALSSAFFLGLGLFLFNLIRQQRFLVSVRRSACSINDSVEAFVVVSNDIDVAFSTYLFKKYIYLPASLNSEQANIIVQHELNHFRYGHHRWQLMETLIVYFYWFNPLSFYIRRIGETYRELECDDVTTRHIDRFRYGEVLVEVAESLNSKQKSIPLGHYWAKKGSLKKRIANLLGQKENIGFRWLKLSLLILATSALSGCLLIDYTNTEDLEDRVLSKIEQKVDEQRANNTYVEFDQIPQYLIDLLIFAEDKRFYSHSGVDNLAMTRASVRFLQSKVFNSNRYGGGASTITMQLAKFTLDEFEEGYSNGSVSDKARQMRIAKIIEKQYSKNEILSMYFSSVFMGNRNYGIKQAAEFYYHIPYSELSIEQSAMIIQMLSAPTFFNPLARTKNAENRARTLLTNFINR